MNNYFKNTCYEDACISKIEFQEDQGERILKWLSNPKDILFIYSEPGLGKTYLTSAIINYYDPKPIYYVEEKTLFDKMRNAIAEGKNAIGELESICDNYFMIFDDMMSYRQQSSEWSYQIHFAFIDNRMKYRRPTIITSNLSPEEIGKFYHERFVSRLTAADNTVIKLTGLDMRKYKLDELNKKVVT